MKIRQGFVSNSSTTSFCIYGTDLSEFKEELEEKFKVEGEWAILEAVEKETGLFTSSGQESENLYIGRKLASIKDEETGKQFKEGVKEKIKKLMGKEIECYNISEAWRDG
jgi:hypothetical protein